MSAPEGMSEQEWEELRKYMVFSNGDGYSVKQDLMHVFYHFQSEAFNEELEQFPHPYREYVKAGCRMVMDKINKATKLAEDNR